AGYRVVLVPDARLAVAADGVDGARRPTGWITSHRLGRRRRTAQLHRRLVYAPATAVPLHWLSLLPLAVLRSLARLVTKEPGLIPGEFAAALTAAVAWRRLWRSRRRMAAARRHGWGVIAPLRIPSKEVRR